jgi:hypothetical protein
VNDIAVTFQEGPLCITGGVYKKKSEENLQSVCENMEELLFKL